MEIGHRLRRMDRAESRETIVGMDATKTTVAPDIMADVQVVADCFASGHPVPPDVARRVHERAAAVRRQILERQAVHDIGVEIIRELRGELPAS